MLIWSATESLVTIMCSSIPVLRPLYIRIRYGKDGKDSSSLGRNNKTSYKLPMYGSGRKYDKMSGSGPGDPNIETKNLTVINYNSRNTSADDILPGAADIAVREEISVSYD